MFIMKWTAIEVKIHKTMHFIKEVEHILHALNVTDSSTWRTMLKRIFEEPLSVGLHFQGLAVDSVLSI